MNKTLQPSLEKSKREKEAYKRTISFYEENTQPEKTPIIFYQERIATEIIENGKQRFPETWRLWRKKGHTSSELILTQDSFFRFVAFYEMNDKTYALFNTGKKIIAIEADGREIKDVYVSDFYLNQIVISKDKNRLLIFRNQLDEDKEPGEDSLEEFNIVSGKLKTLWKGTYAPFDLTSIDEWLENDKKLLFHGEREGLLIFDMRSGKYGGIEEKAAARLKGEKVFLSQKLDIPDRCLLDFMGSDGRAVSVYEVIDLASGTSLGDIGERGKRIEIIRKSPDESDVLFSIIPQKENTSACGDETDRKYYILSVSPALSIAINEAQDFRSVLAGWYPNEAYQERDDEQEKIFSQKGGLLFTLPKAFSFLAFYYQHQEKPDIFGGARFDTVVEGYLKTMDEDTLGGRKMKTNAYFVITKFQDEKFRESIKDGIEKGNNVNKKENNLYLFNLGCFNGFIVGDIYPSYIDEETQRVLLGSTADKPVNIKLYFNYHDGMDCLCCHLAYKIRVVK